VLFGLGARSRSERSAAWRGTRDLVTAVASFFLWPCRPSAESIDGLRILMLRSSPVDRRPPSVAARGVQGLRRREQCGTEQQDVFQ
jgi:hypothetical protein